MSKRHKRRAGFSLIELIVALALGGVVVSAMLIVTTFASRRQLSILRDVTMVGQGVLSIEALRASLRDASYIVSPSSGSESGILWGYTNADQVRNFQPIVPLVAGLPPREYFYFCTANRRFYRYAGTLGNFPALMPGGIICGQNGGVVLAGDPRLTPSFRFSRGVDSSNIITIDYTLSYSSNAAAAPQMTQGQTSVMTQAPLL